MILEATHSHLYPGHRGRISGPARIAEIAPDCDCLVAFVDGSAATARLTQSAEDWQLQTRAYRTAAGTDIAEKRWLVRLEEEGDRVVFGILDKVRAHQPE